MTTLTGNSSKLDDTAVRGFDRLIASAGPAQHPAPLDPETAGSTTRSPRGVIATVVVITMVIAAVVGALSLLEFPGQPAEAVSPPMVGDVTASEIVEIVQTGWVDAGVAGTASCLEPAAQTPGTTVACTAVYDGAPITFTATLGDVDAGESRVTVTAWSNGPIG